ncbi:hypothetical protein CENSYa_1519 [Cenarchaeum symbiosum A]|uniref:Uncharacterized protein n=1 Tax=Cenarchaeum symbiosum (strain A) TaxID=414004 RepID=A0RXS4_CENSY|nr:hypothetical protein CENSYa_1519 [Cenarchaeum symbiosum A]
MRVSGIALTGFAAIFALLALTPASASFLPADKADSHMFYGMAELVHMGGDGEIVSSQIIHNRVLNTGEDILIRSVFGNISASEVPRLICISDRPISSITVGTDAPTEEELVAADFDPSTDFAPTFDTCIEADIDTTTDTSIATMTATFLGANATTAPHIGPDETITHLVICNQNVSTTLTNCGAAGNVFVAVNVDDITIPATDWVVVTYSFNLTSPNS